jgi:hypothetical protein
MSGYKVILSIVLAILISQLTAQNYNTASIPDSLKQNACCVIRNYSRVIELKSENRGVEKIHKVLSILNKNGVNKAILAIPYDKNSTIVVNDIILFDKNGKVIRKVKSSEIKDYPAFEDFILYSDDRMKLYKPDFAEYPYTVEYDYEIRSTNNVSYRYWNPVHDYDISAEYARFTIVYPEKIKINIKEIKVPSSLTENNHSSVTRTWEMKNFRALEEEPFDLSFAERIPCVYVMPAVLMYDNYVGAANNWIEYGKWVYDLFNDRDELTDVVKQKVTVLLSGKTDSLERIKALYEFMQQNTRYVAINLGIGGFQPTDAKTVCQSGYGDCKALSNFMYSLLKYAGIRSYTALVSAGSYIIPVFKDFPNFNQLNHVILCVPYKSDTIWLECTNQKMPFGFLGEFTDDRDVLLITENGGKFAHTKKYDADDNLRICKGLIKIDTIGTASCVLLTRYQGLQYDAIFELLTANPDEQKKWLYSNTALPSSQIKDFLITDHKQSMPVATVDESIISRNYCSHSGKYLILPLNLINARAPIPKMLKTRYSDLIIERSYIEYDTLVFHIPGNLKYETVPLGKTINSDFGNYSYSVKASENTIIYTRKMSINQGRYKPSDYKALYEFMLSVSTADNVKVILSEKP